MLFILSPGDQYVVMNCSKFIAVNYQNAPSINIGQHYVCSLKRISTVMGM